LRIGLALAVALASASPLRGAEPLVVALRPEARPAAKLVRLNDIAEISGGTQQERELVSQLDIADAPASGVDEVVTRSQVEFRLVLGGVRENVHVTGAEQTKLTSRPAASLDDLLLASIRLRLAERLHVEESTIELELMEPLPEHLRLRSAGDDIEFRPVLPAIPRPGPMRLKTAVYVDGRLRHLLSVHVEFAMSGDDDKTAQVPKREPPMQPAAAAAKKKEEPIVIRPRDVVRLSVRGQGLTVSIPAAEALQSGRVGDSIRVRNPRSGRIVAGRVVSAGEVEIEL
jgi:hypothetical protein